VLFIGLFERDDKNEVTTEKHVLKVHTNEN